MRLLVRVTLTNEQRRQIEFCRNEQYSQVTEWLDSSCAADKVPARPQEQFIFTINGREVKSWLVSHESLDHFYAIAIIEPDQLAHLGMDRVGARAVGLVVFDHHDESTEISTQLSVFNQLVGSLWPAYLRLCGLVASAPCPNC